MVTTDGLAASAILTIASLKSFKLNTGVSAAGLGELFSALGFKDSESKDKFVSSESVGE